MLTIPRAEIYVLTDAEGGHQALADGMRPAVNLDGNLYSATIRLLDGVDRIPQGARGHVSLMLPYGDQIGLDAFVRVGAEFTLQSASVVLAKGHILDDGQPGSDRKLGVAGESHRLKP